MARLQLPRVLRSEEKVGLVDDVVWLSSFSTTTNSNCRLDTEAGKSYLLMV